MLSLCPTLSLSERVREQSFTFMLSESMTGGAISVLIPSLLARSSSDNPLLTTPKLLLLSLSEIISFCCSFNIMEAEGDNNNIIIRFIYTGADGEHIPDDATHIFVRAKFIPASAFEEHPNVLEVVCHEDVETVERRAFYKCRLLRKVIMPGVKVVEKDAFQCCEALTDVECGKLEIIGVTAFHCCISLKSIDLSSVEIAETEAFNYCKSLKSVYLPSIRTLDAFGKIVKH